MGHTDNDKSNAIAQGYADYLADQEDRGVEKPLEGFRLAMSDILRGPREKRRERIAELKARVTQFNEAWHRIICKMVDHVLEDPDMSEDDFSHLLNDLVDKKLPDQSHAPLHEENQLAMNRANRSFSYYLKMRDRASSLIEGYRDPAQLFEKIFGVKPFGPVAVKEGVAHIHFDCQEMVDFMVADHGGPIGVREADSYAHKNLAGSKFSVDVPNYGHVFCTATNLAALGDNPLNVADLVYKHEEQHVITDIFEEGIDDAPYDEHDASELYRILSDEKILELNRNLDDFVLKFRRTQIDIRAKSEILSFLKEGMDLEGIYLRLSQPKAKGGIYDYAHTYLDDPQMLIEAMLGESAVKLERCSEFKPIFDDVAKRILRKEYVLMLKHSLEFIENLREFLDDDEIIKLLTKEPIRRWRPVARRIMRNAED